MKENERRELQVQLYEVLEKLITRREPANINDTSILNKVFRMRGKDYADSIERMIKAEMRLESIDEAGDSIVEDAKEAYFAGFIREIIKLFGLHKNGWMFKND